MGDPERVLPASVALLALLVGLLGMATVSNPDMLGTRLALLLGQLALIAPFWLSAAALRIPAPTAFALDGLSPRAVAFSAGCGLGLWIASAGLLQLQYAVWPPPQHVLDFFERLHAKLDLWPPWQAAFSMLAIAVGPALSEELAFRGAVLGSLRRHLGGAGAVFATAAVFSAIHYPPGGYRIPFTFALGCALGALRLHTGSLVPVIAAHAVLNATTVVIASQFGDVTAPTEPSSIGSGAAALAVGLFVTAAFARGLRRRSPAVQQVVHSTR
jgi:uncharacterized protein